MPYYAQLAHSRRMSRLAQSMPAPIMSSGLPSALVPPVAATIPSAGGAPALAAPGNASALPPGTVLQYSAQTVLSPSGKPPLGQRAAAAIGASLAQHGAQLIANTMPNFGAPASGYPIALTVQLLNSFQSTDAVQGAIDIAVESVAGLSLVSSAASVAGTTIPGQSLGPATPAPSGPVDNLSTFLIRYWPWVTVGALALVAYSEARGSRG